ncbi:SDR family oxidoreductase [Xanthocytophaga agilis]|uniref:SDR family oxidoreductase n=1 Tax=Xanthocytophaga agilis TaxID=3048010 RepID=A0AAE3UBF8_9BACT|nr:SDR family oxidoreductase [Xanthocytophaga agilis]MDJ1499768.1 SDR family oxidoreductase [Xanthocytophaga agilis]
MTSITLKGQAAIVTGSSSGIGKAIALALGKAGADVLVNYHGHAEEGEQVAEDIRAMGVKSIAIKADVSKENDVNEMFDQALKTFGRIDIVVSNSGIQKDSPLVDMTLDQWNQVINVNLTGAFLCARRAAQEFRRQGIDTSISKAAGKLIFMSSVHEVIPWGGHCNYAASKGGMMLFMKSISQELAPHKIRVNSIGPGAIQTSINKEVWTDNESKEKLLELIPYGRIGLPEDVGKVAVWLASDEADYVNGTTIFVDGGMTLYPEFADNG